MSHSTRKLSLQPNASPPISGGIPQKYQWMLLGFVLISFIGFSAFDLYGRYRRTAQLEAERLSAMTRVLSNNLEQNLLSIDAVLSTLQDTIPRSNLSAAFNERLGILVSAMPSVRTITYNDSSGTIRATSRIELLGTNNQYSDRDYFKEPFLHPSKEGLFVSAPFMTNKTQVFSIAISKMVSGADAAFAGVIVATLDPAFWLPLLASVRYAEDILVSLTHGDGTVFLMVPHEKNSLTGINIANPDSLFLRHKASGAPDTVISGLMLATGENRMIAQRTVQPAELKMNKSLEVAISRLNGAIFELWRHEVWVRVAYLLAMGAFSVIGLLVFQRRTSRLTVRERQAREALESSEHRMRMVIDNIPGLVAYWNSDLRCEFANANYKEYFGRSQEEMRGIGIAELLGKELFARNESYIRAVLRGEPQVFEQTLNKADGSTGHTFAHYIPDRDGDKVRGFFVTVNDVTPLKLSEQKLRHFEAIVESSQDAIISRDLKGIVTSWNSGATETFGYQPQEMIGRPLTILFPAELQNEETSSLDRILREETVKHFETQRLRKDGTRFDASVTVSPIRDTTDAIIGASSITRDITERKKAEEALERLARTDTLTGLANRRYFMELAAGELARTIRYGGEFSMLMMDIDHFKQVNDTYGHRNGDLVLQALASVSRSALREIDLVGRIGGEEFAVMLPQTEDAQAFTAAERLRAALAETAVPREDGDPLRFTVSIGVATLRDKETDLDALLGFADQALYQAKNGGRNQVRVYLDI